MYIDKSSFVIHRKSLWFLCRSAVEENNREAGNSASYSVASVAHIEPRRIPSRFNPYSAPSDDVFRARLLLSDEQYQVNWLYLEPGCVFTLKIYAPTMVSMIVAHCFRD